MPARRGGVHVATTRRVYKGKTYVTHLLRRSIRKGKTVIHETLGNLSHLPEDVIEIIKRSLKGETFVPAAEAFRIVRTRAHGHVDAVLTMIRKLRLEELIASKPSAQRDLVIAMIAERLLFPSSKLAHTRHWHSTTLADELDVAYATEDHLYEAMDWLLKRQGAIEKRLPGARQLVRQFRRQAACSINSGSGRSGSARFRRQASSSPLRRAASKAANASTPGGDQLIP